MIKDYKNIAFFLVLELVASQTAQQIQQAKELVKKGVVSEQQAIDAAKARGISDSKINSMLQKKEGKQNSESINIPTIQKSSMNEQKVNNEDANNDKVSDVLIESDNSELESEVLEIIDEGEINFRKVAEDMSSKLRFFGYDIFLRDPELFQASSSGAVDPDYLIGPGDDIIVMLWGETQFRLELSVDREGFVFIPEIGQVFVNGLNLNLLESKLFKVFSQSYASLNPRGQKPTTFLDVSLGDLRPLRIHVLGEVSQPGAYTVNPSSTLFSSLYYFNGPNFLGSLRDIQLIRNDKKISSIDFYDYLLTGKKPRDEKLQLDDVIFIPKRLKTVTIEGQINRSGIYELKDRETLKDLLSIAGGLKASAYLDRAQIDRIIPFDERLELGMDRMIVDVNLKDILNSKSKFLVNDGDQIRIFSILEQRQNTVTISGAISRPGTYDLGKGLKLSDLVEKADGLLGDAYKERVDVVRTNPDYTESLIKLDLGKALEFEGEENINLQGSDFIRIYGMTEMIPKYYVSIKGHVLRPGRYPLQKGMTLYDLIFKAGGFIDEEFKNKTYLDRAELVRKIKNSDDKEIIPFDLGEVLDKKGLANLELKVDDFVEIYSLADMVGGERWVYISGHVKRPGRYELFEDNMTIYDLLFKSGGFEDPLFRSQTYLNRADLVRYDKDRITQSLIPFSIDAIMDDKNNEQNITLMHGDEIKVYSERIFNSKQTVSIDGLVKSPGTYDMKTEMTLKDLILEAGGLDRDQYGYRVELARLDVESQDLAKYADVITFNIDTKFRLNFEDNSSSELIDEANNFILKPYDMITLRPHPYLSNMKKITVSGEILYPGEYTILSSQETISDIVNRAGGLTPSAYQEGSIYSRKGEKVNLSIAKILKNPGSKLDFKIMDGDVLIIASNPNIIKIMGEVNNPGNLQYIPNKRLKYYLKRSGGFSPNVDKNNIWIEYPDGMSKKYKKWSILSPSVQDGSLIQVGKKPEKEPVDSTEFLKEVATIFASIAQALAMLAIASQS